MTQRHSTRFIALLTGGMTLIAAHAAWATPTITSLGSGAQTAVTNDIGGTIYTGPNGIGATGAGRWTMTGSILTPANYGQNGGNGMSADGAYLTGTMPNNGAITGNAANPVNPAYSIPSTFTTVTLPANGACAARYNVATNTWQMIPGIPNDAYSQSLGCFGSGDSGNVHTPHGISSTGRYVVGQGYISTYNSTGTQVVGSNSFRWRAWIWDADTNTIRILPTPFRTTTQTQRRRDGTAYAVSTDGTVIVGAQEHNSSTSPSSADPDGSRAVVWRWDSNINDYVMSYLPNGVNGSGFPYIITYPAGSMHMNADGTIIVAMAIDNSGATFIGKWVWNSGSSSWDPPINIGSQMSSLPAWLPPEVTDLTPPACTPNVHTLGVTGMSADGNTIVGMTTWSTCGSFIRSGWIWHSSDNLIKDWYEYLIAQGTPGIAENYYPVDVFINDGNPNKGLPKLGNPSGISPDGNQVVGFQGGNLIIPDAVPYIVQFTGGPSCVAPLTTQHPVAAETFSNCDSFLISSRAAATLPVDYQWYKDGSPLIDGPTGTGSTISGATTYLLRITNPNPQDEGDYTCEATGTCGSPAVSNICVATAAVSAPANDTCATPQVVGEGTNLFAWNPCGAFYNEGGESGCEPNVFADVWFSYVPTFDGDVRIETCGSNFDTIIDIFDTCNGAILACNDDFITGPSTGCSASRSRISNYPVLTGVPVLIRVSANSGFLSSSAGGNISINPMPALPANDECVNAATALLGANALDTNEATNDTIVSCNTGIASRDVWFNFSSPISGLLTAQTCPGTSWNTVLSIHDGPCGPELACNDNMGSPAPAGCSAFSQSRILNFPAIENIDYYIRVGGNSTSAFGTGQLVLSFNPLGDLNCSGTVDGNDISHFVQALLDPAGYTADHDGTPFAPCSSSLADTNQDLLIDMNDVQPFVDMLIAL